MKVPPLAPRPIAAILGADVGPTLPGRISDWALEAIDELERLPTCKVETRGTVSLECENALSLVTLRKTGARSS